MLPGQLANRKQSLRSRWLSQKKDKADGAGASGPAISGRRAHPAP